MKSTVHIWRTGQSVKPPAFHAGVSSSTLECATKNETRYEMDYKTQIEKSKELLERTKSAIEETKYRKEETRKIIQTYRDRDEEER